MASTGFWPVKSRLKEVIDYAENPDKTTDEKFLDEDLWAALRYVENDQSHIRKSVFQATARRRNSAVLLRKSDRWTACFITVR